MVQSEILLKIDTFLLFLTSRSFVGKKMGLCFFSLVPILLVLPPESLMEKVLESE